MAARYPYYRIPDGSWQIKGVLAVGRKPVSEEEWNSVVDLFQDTRCYYTHGRQNGHPIYKKIQGEHFARTGCKRSVNTLAYLRNKFTKQRQDMFAYMEMERGL
ncbi:MAG: hypothetical protein HY367_01740 [Candidatus Aenigmarchaeota archaeon]|nr:hypothetical protein [Candidatus Aenigmarchaeota archaeon]